MLKCLSALVVISVVAYLGIYFLLKSDQFQLFGEMVSHVVTDKKVVALTFDDGPTPDRTIEILKILDNEKIKATFFLNGRFLEQHPVASR